MTEEVALTSNREQLLQERAFLNRIEIVQKEYLAQIDYHNRLAVHRYPDEVRHDTLRDLNNRILTFQSREEIRDFDPAWNAHGYATSVIGQCQLFLEFY